MTTTRKKYWLVLAGAIVGVVLVCAGLCLAALSNPRRFTLDVTADRQIGLLAFSGFACTVTGVGLLLKAASYTTKSMSPQTRNKIAIGVGIGFALQLTGLFLSGTGQVGVLIGLSLILAGVPAIIWGCLNYAEGKGHSKWVGLVGVAGIIGLIVLIALPNQHEETK